MMLRRNTRLSIAVLTAVMAATTACTSGTTGEPTPSSATASTEASSAFPSESVPPGVEKDSVLDLNSTKDMTGVVTTVPINQSPYIDHFPDICAFISTNAMRVLGVENKKRGFRGTRLVVQACTMQSIVAGNVDYSVTVTFYINNIKELLEPANSIIQENNIKVSNQISGVTTKLPRSGADDTTFREECGTAWGTFFGGIIVNYRTKTPETVDPCARSIEAAAVVAPLMPKSPSEMRPAT